MHSSKNFDFYQTVLVKLPGIIVKASAVSYTWKYWKFPFIFTNIFNFKTWRSFWMETLKVLGIPLGIQELLLYFITDREMNPLPCLMKRLVIVYLYPFTKRLQSNQRCSVVLFNRKNTVLLFFWFMEWQVLNHPGMLQTTHCGLNSWKLLKQRTQIYFNGFSAIRIAAFLQGSSRNLLIFWKILK